ncbi:MAG: mechanosensitive ion channel domain-containing protein [Pseudomonadota bacterium]
MTVFVCVLALSAFSSPHAADSRTAAAADTAQMAADQFRQELARVLDEEKSAVTRLRENVVQERERQFSVTGTVGELRIQYATLKSLFVSPDATAKSLDDAWQQVQAAAAALDDQLGMLRKQAALLAQRRVQSVEQTALYQKQLADMRGAGGGAYRDIVAETGRLLSVLGTKAELMDTYEQLVAAQIASLAGIRQDIDQLAEQFENRIRQSKRADIFLRRTPMDPSSALSMLVGEMATLAEQWRVLLTSAFWIDELQGLWRLAGFSLASFALAALVWLWLLVRFRGWLGAIIAKIATAATPSCVFCLKLLRSHLIAAGIGAGLYACLLIDMVYFSVPALQHVAALIMLWVFTGWFLFLAAAAVALPDAIRWHASARHLARLMTLVRVAGVLVIGLHWSLPGEEPLLTIFVRLGFELGFLWWALSAGRCLQQVPDEKAVRGQLRFLAAGWVVGIGLIGLIVELAGFGQLAQHWFLSWGRTVVVALWAVLVFNALQQWEHLQRQTAGTAEAASMQAPFRWLAIQAAELGWFLCAVLLLILSWGGGRAFIDNLMVMLRMPLSAGSLRFSLFSILAAVLTLLLTHAVAGVWRHMLRTRFFSQSGLESGLQESIVTVTAYILWGLGILVALTVFGLDSASLAVAFGAVGIGLGFGLQNIFSNFVSGLILLFERPIQVGDDVEIDGVWATVKKINVRATVVQTYDNASLIIPNAEFISKQVTNWSFQDRRVRRRVNVGVAYGSDLEQVQGALLEIAASVEHVLKNPAPDVLFVDFGDSALVFRLRFWTDVDNMLRVESAVRFAIDHIFRERGIEIAFPQRDIHIRTQVQPSGGAPAQPSGGAPALLPETSGGED